MASFGLDTSTGTYVDLSTGERLSAQSITLKYQHVMKKGSPHTMLTNNALTRKADRVDYLPGNKKRFVEEPSGKEVINVWQPGG